LEDQGSSTIDCHSTPVTFVRTLDNWFGAGHASPAWTAIEQAGAIVYYRRRISVPVVETIVCDGVGQFKLPCERLPLCWIHAGRHYEKRSLVVPRHAKLLDAFAERSVGTITSRCAVTAMSHPTTVEAKRLRGGFGRMV